MKTALVTGGTGFIGVHLANALLERGLKVTVYDKARHNYKDLNPQISFELVDIRKAIPSNDFDYVYHLAALRSVPESFLYPEEYTSTNIWGTYNIIRSFPGSRVVFASSSAATEGKSIYGITKKCAEHFVNTHKNSVSIRFMNVYGEGQRDLAMAVPAFMWALKHNKKATINGDGSLVRDYTYVQDLTEEIIRIGESKIKGQTETGYGSPIKIMELYKLLARMSKKKENFKLGPARRGDMKFTCSKYKIKEPKFGFMEGMRRTVRWYIEEGTF
jgi:UDP-glucose 4-epimerase